MENLKKKSFIAFLWDFTGKIINQAVTFAISVILARILEPEQFGLIAMVMVILTMANTLMDAGLGAALIQRSRVLPIHYSSVFYFNLFIGFVLTGVTFLSAEAIAGFYGRPELILLTQVMSVSFIISSLVVVQNSRLTKELNFKKIAILKLISSFISGVVGVLMAMNNYGVWSLVTQMLLGILIYAIIVWLSVRWVPLFSFSIKALKQLWGYGFRMFLSSLLHVVFKKADVMIVGKLFAPATLGFFQRAKSLDSLVIQYSSASMMQVLFPLISKIQNDLERLRKIVLKALNVLSLFVFFLLGFLYLCADNIIILLLTEKWLPCVIYFKILILAGYVYPFGVLLVNIISGRGNSKTYLKIEVMKKTIVGLNLIFGFLIGIEGYLYGRVVVSIIGMSINLLYASRELEMSVFKLVHPIWPHMLLALVIVLVLEYFSGHLEGSSHYFQLFVNGSSYVILYFGLTYLLKLPALELIWNEFGLRKILIPGFKNPGK